MLKQLVRRVVLRLLRMRGYTPYQRRLMLEHLEKDFALSGMPVRTRLWAYRNRFFCTTVLENSITEENAKHYLPDIKYIRLHPSNGKYNRWIDDKLAYRYVFAPFAQYLPAYYFHKVGRVYHRLMDCGDHAASREGLLSLLRDVGALAVKATAGSLGKGFHRLGHDAGAFSIDGRTVTEEECGAFVEGLDDYLFTEYLRGHEALRRIYDVTPSTLRVMTINNWEDGPRIIGSLIRFGAGRSGYVDVVSAGGVCCGVDLETGAFFRPKCIVDGRLLDQAVHPDTGAPLSGEVPCWQEVRKLVLDMCAYAPHLCYLGFDVVVTDGGPKVIEINSLQGLNLMQEYYPLLDNEYARAFFKRRGIL